MTERKSSIKLSKFFNLSSTSLSSLTHLKNDSKNEKNDKEKDKETLNLNFQKKMNLSKVDEKLNNLQHSTGTVINESNPSPSNLLSSNGSSSNISANLSSNNLSSNGGNKTELMNIDENESLPISSPPLNPSPGNPSQVNLTHISSKNNSSSNLRSRTSSPPMSRSNSVSKTTKPRFRMLDNGLHEHNLRSAKRQEKLSNMLKDLLGAKKLRDEAKSAVPNILGENISPTQSPNQSQVHLPIPEADKNKPPTLFAGLVNHVKNYSPETSSIDQSFVEKYGRCQEVIGKGSYGTVRISHKKLGANDDDEILYAVKEFKRNANESEKKYNRRLTSEFCISSSLKNINIIDTLDLLKDAKGDYVEVMEFCPGGDLYTLIIASGKLEYAEADCFFKQLIKGVNYMHDMGVSHRDLKPENLLLTQNGILKITDFGNSECFRMAWEQNIQLSQGICGSSPYIAPEEFTDSEFDPRGVDIWSCGVIYMAMRTGRQLWQIAKESDEFFKEYLVKRKNSTGYEPIENLKRARCRNVIYSILDPKPGRRITGKQILSSEWGREIKLCSAAQGK